MRSLVDRLMRSVWPFVIGSSTGPRSMRNSSGGGLAGRFLPRLKGLKLASTPDSKLHGRAASAPLRPIMQNVELPQFFARFKAKLRRRTNARGYRSIEAQRTRSEEQTSELQSPRYI